MSEFDTGALRYVFPEELLLYFDIVESGIHTDKPTSEDYLEVVFKRRTSCQKAISKKSMRAKASLINGFRIFLCVARQCS